MNSAAETIAQWRRNPAKFVWDNFHVEPDPWQKEALEVFPSQDPDKLRISLQACAGPGKTALLAWCGWNFLLCYGDKGNHPKGAAVAITSDNLKDNLWPEFSKWQALSPILKECFVWTKERIFAKDHPETWFMSARSWPKSADAEQQGQTLSGLHSKYVMAIIDESGGIPVTVLKAAEQALSTKPAFGKILQAGNPINLEGMLYAAATSLRSFWHIIKITGDPDDPRRSPRINIEWARDQIKQFGRNNPWVMAYILGQFPPSSINSLIGPEEVEAAMKRRYKQSAYEHMQKRIGVDVAREGNDRSVLFPRQGKMAFQPVVMRNAKGHEIASRLAVAKERWKQELEFIDDTGGFGGAVIESMQMSGASPIPVNFSSRAPDPRYFNLRSYMWMKMCEWIRAGGCLPNMPELVRELTTPTYTFKNGLFALEEKAMIKKRLGFSPDLSDALALTFALPDVASFADIPGHKEQVGKLLSEYDPYENSRT